MLSAIIIDDEQFCIDDLNYLIEKNKLPVNVIAHSTSGQEGIELIKKNKPDLVFLDIVMPGMSGFEMLEKIPDISFNLIVTTSMDKFAVQAIRASAIDFLVKPVRSEELSHAVDRAIQMRDAPLRNQLNLLRDHLQQKNKISKIAVSIADGVQLIRLEDIIYFKADGNYTTVFMNGGKSILVTRQIGKFEELLTEETFFRIHSSYLINLNFVNKFIRSDGGYVVMENGESITVARNRKDEFLEKLGRL